MPLTTSSQETKWALLLQTQSPRGMQPITAQVELLARLKQYNVKNLMTLSLPISAYTTALAAG